MITKFNLFVENSLFKTELEAYHRSDKESNLEELKLEFSNDETNVFGKAIYFSSSPDTTYQFGKYLGKYRIKLNNPLNLNIQITPEYANVLLKKFINKYKIEISYYDRELGETVNNYDFSEQYDDLQYGDFFLELQYLFFDSDGNKYFYDFIKNVLKFNSFYHYSDYGTNFINEIGDYGFCYGIYDENDIELLETF